jgi:hypothetical protein
MGELLNVRKFSDGSFLVSRLQDSLKDPATAIVRFEDGAACQEFVSRWYARG